MYPIRISPVEEESKHLTNKRQRVRPSLTTRTLEGSCRVD